MEPVLGQSLPVVRLPVLHEVCLAARYAANLVVPLGVGLLHRHQGVHQEVQFEVGRGVRAEVLLAVLLEVGLSLRPEVEREVRE